MALVRAVYVDYRTTFTLDVPVGVIMSDKATYEAVLRTMAQLEASGMIFGIMDGERGRPLRHVLGIAGEAAARLIQAVAAVLAGSESV